MARPRDGKKINASEEFSSAQDWLAGGGKLGRLIREYDWSKTPLGAIDGWPQSLKTSVNLILNSQHPMWLGWGPGATFLYNDAYIQVLSLAKHPWALGKPTAEVWPEIWDICGPLADKVFEKGEASFVDDVRLLMRRADFIEETYYSFSYSPIRDESGKVAGLFCPSTEVTPKVVNARRLSTLSELSANALIQKTTEAACASVAETLSKNPDDVPFALLYLVDAQTKLAHLEEACGVAPGISELTPESIDLSESATKENREPCLWPVAEIVKSGHSRVVSVENVEGLPLGIAQQSLKQAIVLPVTSRGEGGTVGVLVAGVSPARQLDAEYRTFYELVAGQIATAILNVRAAEEERKRVEALAEIDRAKTTFFSNVSHEFRTPLTLMLGPVEELLSRSHTELTPAAKNQLELVNRNGSRLLRLVNTLLDFSRIEAGRMQAIYQPTDLSAFTVELASVFRSATEKAGLALELDCTKLSELVFVDRGMWEKIVLNLISNAFKFTFEGTIAVSLKPVGEHVELRVRDTGVGIPAEEISRLFDRFHRIENTRSRTHEGSGIGLALVQELVKLHGGSVRAESVVGEGTTFVVSVPLGSSHLPADRVGGARSLASTAMGAAPFVEEALRWLPDHQPKESEPPIPALGELIPTPCPPGLGAEEATDDRPTVLVADDNSDMRQYLIHLLSERYNVRAVADGQAALAAVRERIPALVLSDVMMPNLDGFGLLQELRSDPATRTVPVILLSARAGEESRVEGMEHGADDYLIKPFSARELLARVQTHLEMARIRKQAGEALRKSEERARSIVDSIADGFMTLDHDWRITFVNPRAEEILARLSKNSSNLVGKNYFDEFPGTRGTVFEESYLRVSQGEGMVSFEAFYPPLESWFDVRAYPSRDGISIYFLDITERKTAQGLLAAERNVLEQIAIGASLPKILETLARDTEAESTDGMLCSILLFDETNKKLLHGAAPSLPDAYSRAIDGIVIGPCVGSCGTAAFERKPIFVADIATDPLWADFKDLAAAHGFAACCSTPIISGHGTLLGTAAMYYRHPHNPTAHDRQIIARATQLAAIAIERKEAAEALRHRTAEFETLLNQAPLGVYLVDADFRMREANPTALEVFKNIPHVIGRDFREVLEFLWSKPYAEELLKRFRRTLETGEPYVVPEWAEERQDRKALEYYEWRINRIPLPEGRFGVVCYFRDISRQVNARDTIAQSEQRLRLATEAAELGIWRWYPEDDRVTWENDRPYEIFGRSHAEGPIPAAEFRESYCHPEDVAAFEQAFTRTVESGARFFFQGRVHRKDRSRIWVEFTGQVEYASNGNPLRLLGTVQDITERKQAEEAVRKSEERLRTSHEELEQRVKERTQELADSLSSLESEMGLRKITEKALRELSARSLRLQDEERRRFARDLHDSTGQTLAALKMTLAALNNVVAKVPQVPALMTDLNALADQAIQEIRTTSHLLHPPMLDEVGFSSAAQWYVDGFTKRSGIKTTLDLAVRPRLTKDEELVFFRILQESLTNVLRHSGSKSVDIRLDSNNEDAILTIRDYGKGIPAKTLTSFQETAAGVGVGLGGMKQRVRELGGHLTVESDGNGTCIIATLPLTKEEMDPSERAREGREVPAD
jgi:PAS domain S-box-containing protein